MAGERITPVGLKEVQDAINALEREAPEVLRDLMAEIANDIAAAARRRLPKRTGNAASTYKPKSSARGAQVVWGGEQAPYVPWLEFGGRVGRNKSVVRRFVPGGRYLYPAIGDNLEDVHDRVVEALNDVTRSQGVRIEGS